MSTILDALRRLEDEKARQVETRREREILAGAPAAAARPRTGPWVAAAAVVVFLGLVGTIAFLLLRSPSSDGSGDEMLAAAGTLRAAEPGPAAPAARPAERTIVRSPSAPVDERAAAARARTPRRSPARDFEAGGRDAADVEQPRAERPSQAPSVPPPGSRLARVVGETPGPGAASPPPPFPPASASPPTPKPAPTDAASGRMADFAVVDRPVPRARPTPPVEELAQAPPQSRSRGGSAGASQQAVGASAPRPSVSAPAPARVEPVSSPRVAESAAAPPREVAPPPVAIEAPVRVAPRVVLPDVSVEGTVWHPVASRRRAKIESNGETVELHEGDAFGGFVVEKISPSAVTFTHDEVSVTRRVGAR